MFKEMKKKNKPVEGNCCIGGSGYIVLKGGGHKNVFELFITPEPSSQDDQISLQRLHLAINQHTFFAEAEARSFFQNDASLFNVVIEFFWHCGDQTGTDFLKEAVFWYHSKLCQPKFLLYIAFNEFRECPSLLHDQQFLIRRKKCLGNKHKEKKKKIILPKEKELLPLDLIGSLHQVYEPTALRSD
jgi:hypothetical protein